MAAAPSTPYKASLFNNLPDLKDSRHAFVNSDGERGVSLLLDLIEQHGLSGEYGISLLHRHFNIKDDEILVEVNGTTTAWKASGQELISDKAIDRYGGHVIPHSWMVVDDGQLMPYEFRFRNDESDLEPLGSVSGSSFLQDFKELLCKHDLEKVLGLCSIDAQSKYLLEVTEGDANITFPLPPGKNFSDIEQAIPAAWGHWSELGKSNGLAPFTMRGCFQMCVGPYNAHACNHVSAGIKTSALLFINLTSIRGTQINASGIDAI
jgi:hypothetical protein